MTGLRRRETLALRINLWLSVLVLGKSDLTFRLPSAICAIAAIPVVYQTGKELSDSRTGGIAAMMLAWHPEAIETYGPITELSTVASSAINTGGTTATPLRFMAVSVLSCP